jgi:NAD kinase
VAGERVPRVCVVTRPSAYELLLAEHGTRGQTAFFLRSRGQDLVDIERADHALRSAREDTLNAIPRDWRRAEVRRADLDRFLFAPDDIVVCVGQDGLVANVAKYLTTQPVIGVNPDQSRYDGVLVRHTSGEVPALLHAIKAGTAAIERRTLVEGVLDDGQRVRALNELFVGHRSHQSARYRLAVADREERHSSSGVICATGTGATGWCRSIARERRDAPALPAPTSRALAWFVREAFPSVVTETALSAGVLEGGASVVIVSEMDDGGVIFGDGIESDHASFPYGMMVTIRAADDQLHLA